MRKASSGKKNKEIKTVDIQRKRFDYSFVTVLLFGGFFTALLLSFSTSVNVCFTLPKLIILRGGSSLIFLLFLVMAYHRSLQLPRPGITLAVLGMAAWFSVSTVFATHVPTALHGFYGRYNGLLNHLLYLMMFLAIAHMKLSKPTLERILSAFVLSMVPVALYAIAQHLHLDPLSWPSIRPASTIGNPVVLAAVIGMAIPFSMYFSIICFSRNIRIGFAGVTILFFAASAVTISKGPWIGTAIAVLIMLFFYARGDRKRTVRVFCGGFLCLFVTVLFILSDSDMRRLSWSKTALLSSLKSDASVSERAADYDIALQIVKDHPFTGTGFETFRNLYPAYRKAADPNELYKKVPTMVHNGYLQVLQSTGFPGLCLYLVFIFIILRRLIISLGKNNRPYNDNLLTAALLASIIGYLVQDFSGWPEIALTPLFWIISSLAMNIAGTGADDQDISRKYRNTTVGFAVVVLLFSVWLTGDAVVRWKADAAFCQAGAMDADREWTLLEYYLVKAAELMPNEALYADQLGIRYYRRYAASGDIGNYKKSLRLFETTLAANPFATEVLLHSLELDGIAFSRQHITEPSALTKHALKNLPLMDRNNADVYEAMAKLELGRKSFSQSELYIDNALRIDGSKPSALVLAGEICREQKKFPEAVSYYKRVKGSQLFVHARLAAASALFAQKKYDETIEEANDLLLLYPLEVRAILIRGDAFAALGNMEKAVASYREAIWIDPANPFAIRALEQIGHNRKKD